MRPARSIRQLIGFALLGAEALAAPSQAQVFLVAEMNCEQVRALDRKTTVVILPGGILEEHGPYLPAYTEVTTVWEPNLSLALRG